MREQGGENCQNHNFFTTKMVFFLPKRFFWFFMSNSYFHVMHYSKAHFELNTVLHISMIIINNYNSKQKMYTSLKKPTFPKKKWKI